MAILDILISFFLPGGEIAWFRIVLAVILLHRLYVWISNRPRYARFPPPAKAFKLPWLGHIVSFGKNPLEFFTTQAKEVGDVVSFQLLGRDVVLFIGNDAHRAFYDAPEEVLNAAKAYAFMKPIFGPGVVYDAHDLKFQNFRKFTGATMTVPNFKRYINIIENEAVDYFLKMMPGESGEADLTRLFAELTTFTSTACLQGPEVRALMDKAEVHKLLKDMDDSINALSFFYPNFPQPSAQRRNKARRELGALYNAIVKNRRKTGFVGDDLLGFLLNAKYDDGSEITDDEIVGNLIAVMLGGQHNSNTTLTWLAVHTLSQPDLVQRLMEEQIKIMGGEDQLEEPLDFDKVKNMIFLNAAVKETLRLTPPLYSLWRETLSDFKYKDYVIPAGTLAVVCPNAYAISCFSTFSGDPAKFDPDRFIERGDGSVPYSYFPFSLGRHSCIGEKFAYVQMKTIYSTLLRYYDIQLVGSKSDYPIDFSSMVAGPQKHVIVKYTRRGH